MRFLKITSQVSICEPMDPMLTTSVAVLTVFFCQKIAYGKFLLMLLVQMLRIRKFDLEGKVT